MRRSWGYLEPLFCAVGQSQLLQTQVLKNIIFSITAVADTSESPNRPPNSSCHPFFRALKYIHEETNLTSICSNLAVIFDGYQQHFHWPGPRELAGVKSAVKKRDSLAKADFYVAAAGDTSRWNSLVEAAVLDWWDLVSTRVLIHPTNQTAPQRRFCFSTRDGRRSKVCLNVLHPSAPRSRIVVLQVLSSPPIQIILINNIFCVLITKLLLNFFVSSLKPLLIRFFELLWWGRNL